MSAFGPGMVDVIAARLYLADTDRGGDGGPFIGQSRDVQDRYRRMAWAARDALRSAWTAEALA